ncbi:DUF2207 domain-containing protein [Planktosalinus lacus]|uniref:DUF2207 domain-containing protein n=1 Tax=Planktosalinus lacus TaxID=1526573 RepID=A0A8J2V8C7_9FLAO|nr:DUF2207 domain-containing protein [Planktosalinus lacus]GGD84039.1 hypothetical protein GCM10011312_05080 [Planktosalinus lacus]
MRILLTFCLFLFTVNSYSQERILSYTTQIKVEESGDLLVREDITVNTEGKDIKRGIFRTFPTKYKDKLGTNFNVDFQVKEVLKDGQPEGFFTENKNNGVIVYIGDKNTFLKPGQYTYTLIYETTRQIGYFEEFDELYFNAIGGDWAFSIEKATVLVELPEGAEILQVDAFSGTGGATDCDCEIISGENRLKIETNRELQPREQLTFAVAWPKGLVYEPTAMEKLLFFIKSNLYVLVAFLGLLAVFFVYYRSWRKVGVDPPKGTIFPQFDPPKGFSPAQIAILQSLRMTQRAVTAAIVNMAVKGHLKIVYSKKKYTLKRQAEDYSILTDEEAALSKALFANHKIIDLDNKYHKEFSKARKSLFDTIKKQLKPTYFSFNYNHLGKGILASVILVVLTFVLAPSPVIPFILLFLLVAMVILFTYLIKAPTKKGRVVMDDIEGFKMYVDVAEKKQLDLNHEPEMTPQRFEALLPFAIALGVENKWGEKFENALKDSLQEASSYNPSWYSGAAMGAMAFSPAKFSSDMGRSFNSAISSASTPPGSSSGSGGGGFSGGGGGGGGGGGW